MSWEIKSNRLMKRFKLESFDEVILKLVLLAKVADEKAHHPDFAVENYNEITFFLWTHSAGKVTDKDHDMANEIDAIFEGTN